MFLIRLALSIFLFFIATNYTFAENYRVQDIVFDNSDKLFTIIGQGNFKTSSAILYAPTPNSKTNSTNLINNISYFSITNPNRYIIDIPNARVNKDKKEYEVVNSKVINKIEIFQHSTSPEIVRVVVETKNQSDLSKFKLYSNGREIVVKYASNIIENSIQNKFYTPSGDMDKNVNAQNTSLNLISGSSVTSFVPKIQTKYYLSQVAQNTDGLILKGLGQVSMQKINYNSDNTKAEIILDNATLSKKYENKMYLIPSSESYMTYLTLNTLNSKKIKMTLEGKNLRDYRFVMSNDGQSIFVAHRTYVLKTAFASENPKVLSYKMEKNQSGYWIFDLVFDKPVVYDIFELNGSLYLDIDNLSDMNEKMFEAAQKTSDIKISHMKIHDDKSRYIIPMKNLNLAYGNIESNLKSIKLCFKVKPVVEEVKISNTQIANESKDKQTQAKKDASLADKPVIVYVPKNENDSITKTKKKKTVPNLSSMKKVVLDPGHGGSDCGAIRDGVNEKTLNLAVAKLVEQKLKNKNVYVYMTRQKDSTLSLEERVKYSNEINPDIYVSIHANATVQEDSTGLEVHYYKDDSYELAQAIHSDFASSKNLKKWETKDRGVIKSRFYVINHTVAPSVLVEMGFISNPQERAKLLTEDRQEEIADSIVKGILGYLNVK